MKYVDEFRDGDIGRGLLESLRAKVAGRRRLRIMEVCGTHTVSIGRSGLRSVMPREIDLLSGPGCPVCVTAQEDIDKAIALAQQPGVILLTYGDMLKVPGTRSSLQAERARSADVRIVYSPFDALAVARANPAKRVVFLGIGFETTTAPLALVLREARRHEAGNFFVLSVHKLVPPALRALMESGESAIDGFLLPGHVSTIIGSVPYRFLAAEYKVPAVISGFEPLDILQSIHMLARQILRSRAQVEIQYSRAVKVEGNVVARGIAEEVFRPSEVKWRGLGRIAASGLALRDAYASLDAEKAFDLDVSFSCEPPGCACGEIIRGVKNPYQCRLFGKACTPDHPHGPCMVSSEGTCAAYYHYGDWPMPPTGLP